MKHIINEAISLERVSNVCMCNVAIKNNLMSTRSIEMESLNSLTCSYYLIFDYIAQEITNCGYDKSALVVIPYKHIRSHGIFSVITICFSLSFLYLFSLFF